MTGGQVERDRGKGEGLVKGREKKRESMVE